MGYNTSKIDTSNSTNITDTCYITIPTNTGDKYSIELPLQHNCDEKIPFPTRQIPSNK